MREILFRGKRTDNKQWTEGLYALIGEENPSAYIIKNNGRRVRVAHKSISEYTGLMDKNGNRIFEGDIVKAVYKSEYVGVPNTDFGIGVVEYEGTYYGSASYQINIIGEVGNRAFSASLEVEVIGNIHDNPELLEVQK